MDILKKLRKLIWDENAEVFSDEDLQEFLADAGGNVYEALDASDFKDIRVKETLLKMTGAQGAPRIAALPLPDTAQRVGLKRRSRPMRSSRSRNGRPLTIASSSAGSPWLSRPRWAAASWCREAFQVQVQDW